MTRRQLILGTAMALAIVGAPPTAASQEAVGGGGSHTANVLRWRPEIAVAAQRFGMPMAWIEAVIAVESAGMNEVNGRPITSPKGAMGLMQLMPATYTEMQSQYRLGDDPYLPLDNILAGTAFLRQNYDRFGYPGLFAAYNAGPDRYLRSLAGVRLPGETRDYLSRIMRQTSQNPIAPDSIFVDLTGSEVSPEKPASSSVFVPLIEP
jgi:soluble lytic murein transglycosylase-like protein